MSVNRRRWSNDLVDSLMSFQSKGSSQLMDSLEYSELKNGSDLTEEKCTDITSVLGKLNLSDHSVNLKESKESNTSDRRIEVFDRHPDKVILNNDNLSVNINEDLFNKSLIEENYCRNSNATLDQFDQSLESNEKLIETNSSCSGSDTVKLSSSSSCSEITLERQSINSSNSQNLIQIDIEPRHSNNFHSNVSRKDSSNRSCIKVPPDYSNESSIKETLINNFDQYSSQFNIENSTNDEHNLNKFSSEHKEESSLNIIEFEPTENISKYELIKTSQEGHNTHRIFSSPLEFSENSQDLITEMEKPDVWDALLELDRALSPFEECTQDSLEKLTDPSNILTRLSQKFKKTPTRFTEKLVSIMEDSIISIESPTKQFTGDNSEISLRRMTGEFRKLCKFVEDESMPELAPSLTNITGLMLDKTETPEKKGKTEISMTETPKNKVENIAKITSQDFISKAFKCFATPKSKAGSNSSSPIKKFTPTGDKSFEYWERVCNMMCENQNNTKKNPRKSLYLRESSKVNMNEMLTICERQLASLNDSNIEMRSSDPCKKTKNKLEQITITPRSKSVSKIVHTASEMKPCSLTKSSNKKINKNFIYDHDYESRKIKNTDGIVKELFIDDITPVKETNNCSVPVNDIVENHSESSIDIDNLTISEDESLKDESILLNSDQNLDNNEQNSFNNSFPLLKEQCVTNLDNSFQKDFNILSYSPYHNEEKSKEIIYDANEQDCSLLIELAKRRQRCLDTAKLMLEIDREDPIANEDKTCLETLYKLGIQDETFTNVEEDAQFLNTINHCLEYQSYFKNKTEPIMNMFQKLNSPDNIKSKTSSIIRSKKLLYEQNNVKVHTKTLRNSSTKQLCSKPPSSTKCVQDKTLVSNKSVSKTKPKISQKAKVDNTPSLQLKQQKCKLATQEGLKLQVKTPRFGQTPTHLIPKASTTRTSPRTPPRTTPRTPPTTTPKTTPRTTPKTTPTSTPRTTSKTTPRIRSKAASPEAPTIAAQKRPTPKTAQPKSHAPTVSVTSDTTAAGATSPPERESATPRPKLFLTPGKDPSAVSVGRRKPASYFSLEGAKKTTPQRSAYDNVKSPISLYIKSTDADLVQNVQGKINDRFLTPVSKNYSESSPKLKFKLSSKENASPVRNFDENIILPEVNYQSARKVRLIDDKNMYSPNLIPPRSKTKKLLEPIENTVVIRHERRVVERGVQPDYLDTETSIRVQKVAEKASSIRNKFL